MFMQKYQTLWIYCYYLILMKNNNWFSFLNKSKSLCLEKGFAKITPLKMTQTLTCLRFMWECLTLMQRDVGVGWHKKLSIMDQILTTNRLLHRAMAFSSSNSYQFKLYFRFFTFQYLQYLCKETKVFDVFFKKYFPLKTFNLLFIKLLWIIKSLICFYN